MQILIDLSFITTLSIAKKSLAIYTYRFLDSIPTKYRNYICLYLHDKTAEFFKQKYPQYKHFIKPKTNFIISKIPILKGLYNIINWNKHVNRLDTFAVFVPFAIAKNSSKINARKVIVIHDLRQIRISDSKLINSILFRYTGLNKIYFKFIKYHFTQHIHNANSIIAISKYVAEDIIKIWPQAKEKINIIYNGIPAMSTLKTKPHNVDVSDRYILYVNSLLPYKNVLTLIKAFELIKDKTIKLIIVGKETEYWNEVVKPYILKSNFTGRIIHLNYVSDSELQWLYSNASLFVTTSLREGFGYTPIEAVINQCPVISTTCESLFDVTAGKVDYYSPPTSERNLADAIDYRLCNYPIKEELDSISRFFIDRYNITTQTMRILSLITNNIIKVNDDK